MADATPMGNDSSSGQASNGTTHRYPVMHAFSESWLAERRFMPEWAKRAFHRLLGCLQGCNFRPWFARLIDACLPIFVGMFLLGILFNLIEPFGLGNATKAHSQRITARILAPFYRSDAQDHIAVVLVDDQTLRARGTEWPPRYAYYGEMLRRVLAHQPRAVYVDVLMEGRRDYDDSFQDAFDDLKASLGDSRVPVYFGVSSPGGRSIFTGAGAHNVVTSWKGAGSFYPLRISEKNGYATHPAGTGSDDAGAGGDGAQKPSPSVDERSVALALYEAACKTPGTPGCHESAASLANAADPALLAVRWGSSKPVLPPLASEPPEATGLRACAATNAPPYGKRIAQAMRFVYESLLSGMKDAIEDENRARCAYTLTAFEEQLENDLLLGDEDKGTAPLLKDRVVLVGTHLVGLDDRVMSPVHQQIPGVYLHAMALDNLMQWGTRYPHPVSKWRGFVLGVFNALVFSLVGGGVLLLAQRRLHGNWGRMAVLLLALAATGLALGSLAQTAFRMPPGDWIGMGSLVLALSLFVHGVWQRHVQSLEGGDDEAGNGKPMAGGGGAGDGDVVGVADGGGADTAVP